MLEGLKSLVRAGVDAARRLFSGKPASNIQIAGDQIRCVSDGAEVVRHVRDIKHVSLQQSFLGLFGSSLTIRFIDDVRCVVRGLNDRDAHLQKVNIEEAMTRVSVAEASTRVVSASQRIHAASRALASECYLSAAQMTRWEEDFGDLRFLKEMSPQMLAAANAPQAATECRSVLLDPVSWRRTRNDQWVKETLAGHKALLDSIGKVPLTHRQREAILRHDNRVLAVAGAGTGKTTTVVGKVAYLLATDWCRPEEILLLSFSRGAVNELKQRIHAVCGDKVQVRTFHSLGLEIIGKATGRKPAVFEQSSDADVIGRVISYLKVLLADPKRRGMLLSYLAYHYFPDKPLNAFKSKDEYLQHATGHDIRTLKGERVRSNQEAQIANWLYLNGVDYVYESEFKEARTGSLEYRVYKPDFRLPESGVYIEHFGIDRNGNTAPWISREEYQRSMLWKRDLHRQHKTTLIETFSYQAREGTLTKHLQESLAKCGVQCHLLSSAQVAASKEIANRLRPTAKLLATAICLYKGDRLSIEAIRSKQGEDVGARRGRAFMDVFEQVLQQYEVELKDKGEVDFGDMITQAAGLVESNGYKSPFKAVIVDEFQDISRGRAWLLNALLEQEEDARLLCVGDDWQSVYRFTGSDVSLMTGYGEQWPQAVRVDLDQTFRFNDKIQLVSERFITQNPTQLRKTITCLKSRQEPAVHIVTDELGDILARIRFRDPKASVLVLGRYNHTAQEEGVDVEDVTPEDMRTMTVHKAKGLEADYVVVNKVESGRYGFPTEMVDDPLIRMFLADPDNFPNAEERRLFYVALTRARHEIWLRVDPQSLSPFVRELQDRERYGGLVEADKDTIVSDRRCPDCGGVVAIRRNKIDKSVFLGCSYYPRCKGTIPGCPKCRSAIPERRGDRYQCPSKDCGWTAEACPVCGAGFAQQIKGKYGVFKGCSMFRATGCRGFTGA